MVSFNPTGSNECQLLPTMLQNSQSQQSRDLQEVGIASVQQASLNPETVPMASNQLPPSQTNTENQLPLPWGFQINAKSSRGDFEKYLRSCETKVLIVRPSSQQGWIALSYHDKKTQECVHILARWDSEHSHWEFNDMGTYSYLSDFFKDKIEYYMCFVREVKHRLYSSDAKPPLQRP